MLHALKNCKCQHNKQSHKQDHGGALGYVSPTEIGM